MDKEYDSEAIHRLIREDLHAYSVIPIRSWNNEIIGGTYRQEMAQQFNDIVYPRRQLVENKFSVLKRKFNGDLKARRFLIQMKEIANKMIVCNIHRFLLFLIFEVFYKAKNFPLFTVKRVFPKVFFSTSRSDDLSAIVDPRGPESYRTYSSRMIILRRKILVGMATGPPGPT
jgi:hypothetical protein